FLKILQWNIAGKHDSIRYRYNITVEKSRPAENKESGCKRAPKVT
ncbi:MAG: hypothetical protein K0S24_3478, partial [Sphingobacterium sp.]|nr:hypothetical protein [Sphingobacterium sp.]